MYLYEFALQNKELFKLLYTVIIGLICFIIVIRTDKLFQLSYHQGIRYFRNAFFFYGLAFILRYLLGTFYFFNNADFFYNSVIRGVFEFFIIMAGFFLLYSLLWKKFENSKGSISSLFNIQIIVFYVLTLILVFLSIISYMNYKKNKGKHRFIKLYFVVMILNLIAWVSNFAIANFFKWSQKGVINIYALNIIIFFLFLYGVVKVNKKSKSL